jgi:anti-sigma B factor antagonist
VVPQSSSAGSPPATPLSVTVDLPSAQVCVAGELDRESAHHLIDALDVLSTRSSRRWRLDASGVTFCDVGGLRALSSAHALAASHGRHLRLVRSSRPVERLVELLGHDQVFPPTAGHRHDDAALTASRRRASSTRTRHVRCGTTGTA